MKRLTALLLCLLLLAGCGAKYTERKEPETDALTFTDDLGRSVSVEPPRRVAALIGSFADI